MTNSLSRYDQARRALAKAVDVSEVKDIADRATALKEPDTEEAREEARENGESWSEMKDGWIEEWKADNWGDIEQAEFDTDFRDTWKREHGTEFPALGAQPAC
jgi:hypothetical protein